MANVASANGNCARAIPCSLATPLCGIRRALNALTQSGRVSRYQVLVVNAPVAAAYQYTSCRERPIGRIAPRSLYDTESARVFGSAAVSQSVSVVPWNRNGAAPSPGEPRRGQVESFTPAVLRVMPVLRGNRPDIVLAWPGAVSVMAWSWWPLVKNAPPDTRRRNPPMNSPRHRSR